MTVSSTTNKHSYNGNGSQTAFAYTFKIFVAADIQVYLDGALKTINTHYTLSNVGLTGGGNVTFTSGSVPSAATGNVILLRSLALTQGVDLINYGAFDANIIESAYDKLTMMVQQLQEEVSRSIRFSATVYDGGTQEVSDTVANRAGKVLAYDAAGNISIAAELGSWKANWSTNTAFKLRDLVLDAATNNVYICILAHTSGTLSSDVSASKWSLVINASAVAASATTATTKASEAASSATAAANSASTSTTQANTSTAQASIATTKAATATTKAATATTKANEATSSATAAANSATASANSATAGANSASAGSTSATNSANSATAAASSASTASTKASEATTNGAAQVTLATAQVTLATAQTAISTTKAGQAASSATASANSATASANSATAGANSATAAGNSASGASTSATNAASSLSTFQGIFYGALSSVPTSNIATGDLYFDTGNNAMKVYNGSAWQIVAPTVTTVDNSTWSGADLSVANGGTGASSDSAARTNLGLVIGTDVLAPDGDGSSLTGLNAVVVGSTLPSNGAAAGSLFYRTGDKKFFISDGSTWSLVNNSGPAPTGGTVVITSVAELSGSYSYNLGLNFTDDANTDAELTYALSSGAMPTGAVLPSSGSTSITGTIPAVSSDTLFSFQIRATDESALSSVQNYQWTILNSVPATTGGTVTISNVFESSAASYDVDANFTFSAGSVFSAFSLQSGTLPVGLSLNTSTGVISGTTNATKTTYNFTIRATAVDGGSSDQYYAWAVVTAPPVNGTGGLTFNKASGHREHRFVSSGTFQVSQGGNIEVLMVGGGGGGGANAYSGGGGGGGVYYNGAHVVSSNTNYTITIGAGGASQSQGQNTVAFGVTALGGGYGNENSFSYPQASQRPSVGGNGGGGGGNGGGTRLGAAGSLPAVAGWTRHGGNAGGNSSGGGHGGAGGGGAGAAGGNNLNTGASVGGGAVHGAGGAGHQDQGITGSNLYWAGGGGGGSHGGPAHHTSLGGNGGSGGGGGGNTTHGAARGNAAGGTGGMSNGNAGGTQTGSGFGDGGAHTGGGGGGGAGVGGSGIVILRYIS